MTTHRVALVLVLVALVRLTQARGQSPSPAPAASPAADKDVAVETIVFVRHGEKPDDDKGQLNCKGLNRALALPEVLIQKFGRPDYIFAPATTKKSNKEGVQFSYVRPLMTIEPTAIRAGLPVETRYAFDDISSLQEELSAPAYRRATVFVAWEHHLLDEMVKHFLATLGGDAKLVPEWEKDDFDSIFVLRVTTDHGRRSVAFEHAREGLDGVSAGCPGTAR